MQAVQACVSFTLHLCGRSRQAPSAAEQCAAVRCGCPHALVQGHWLASLRPLPPPPHLALPPTPALSRQFAIAWCATPLHTRPCAPVSTPQIQCNTCVYPCPLLCALCSQRSAHQPAPCAANQPNRLPSCLPAPPALQRAGPSRSASAPAPAAAAPSSSPAAALVSSEVAGPFPCCWKLGGHPTCQGLSQ